MVFEVLNTDIRRVGALKLVNDCDRTDHLNNSWLVILNAGKYLVKFHIWNGIC